VLPPAASPLLVGPVPAPGTTGADSGPGSDVATASLVLVFLPISVGEDVTGHSSAAATTAAAASNPPIPTSSPTGRRGAGGVS
jgi:hypothetical protein